MPSMPSYSLLLETVGQPFNLWLSSDQVLPIELLGVEEGIAMTPRHRCCHAHFALPAPCSLPQAVYRLSRTQGECWELQLTPGIPCSDGRHVLQAVFHIDRPA